MSDETHPRILYVGNLEPSVTEELLVTLFGQLGSCQGCKIIREPGSDMYAFVEFGQHSDAQLALMAMNKRIVLGREMKVNWATSPGNNAKVDTSKHFHVFVGDLSQDVESHQLKEAFAPFGEISDCKVIRDSQTHQSKGYAFICFVRQEDAEMAIASMNGQWIGGRAIRTNWANGKATVSTSRTETKQSGSRTLRYDDVYNQSSATNSTVYCGGIQTDLTDELIRENFEQYGNIQDIRVFKEKGYAFIRFDTKESATKAIVGVHGSQMGGFTVKCSWGKESDTSSQTKTAAAVPQQQAFNQQAYSAMQGYYGGGMAPYWGYPQGAYPGAQGYGAMPQQQQQQQQQAGNWGQAAYNQQGYGYGNYGAGAGTGQWPGMQQNGQ